MVAEGLSKQPMDTIAKRIASMGFDCVSYTWPVYLVTNDSLASLTVRQSFQRLGFIESIAGIQANNPSIIDVLQPSSVDHRDDSDGHLIQRRHQRRRNELRGPKQNVNDWYKYMQQGAEAVHSANPDVLVILSGFDFDRDLSFIEAQPVKLTFSGKLVFEAHWYGFSDGPRTWVTGNPNEVCGRVATYMLKTSGYLVDQGYPLFISEFGIDQTGANVNGNRNSSFIQRISPLQAPFRGPGQSEVKLHKVIFHPLTGLCVTRKSFDYRLQLGPYTDSYTWSYSPQKTILVKGTHFCLKADESGTQAKLDIFCTSRPSSEMENRFAYVASDNTIITRRSKRVERSLLQYLHGKGSLEGSNY
ncbi:hypothetical protein F3Y22_tig00113124pilonHSYRG00079 [Hibiscus syriacus]|uniref:Glycoside hydrolase family 5 domain-containing protein n=1 Tax=Hibiscus syriacus TaxID=106335 RepID=A0A6A2XWP1_HIBSY|nr:hypothetical protein F3Y22_tig00113124pilonHSYRG00079 [Hibiscus syriacus]